MLAFKGFQKGLICRGYKFKRNGINETEEANCRKNGFHCAENPLDCLYHYSDWKNSVYYQVEALGDLDETDGDSQISCTKMRIIKEVSLLELLIEGAAFMVKYPDRKWSCEVFHEQAEATDGYAVVRGKNPTAAGKKNAILLLLKEEPDSSQIAEVTVLVIDGERYFPDVWYNIYGFAEESEGKAA